MKITIALPRYTSAPIGGYHVQYQYANMLSQRGHRVTIVFPQYAMPGHWLWARLRYPVWVTYRHMRQRPLVNSLPLHPGVDVRLVPDLSGSALPDADVLIATAWQTAEAMADTPRRCGRRFYSVYDHEYLMTADAVMRSRIEATYRMPYSIVATSKVVHETVCSSGGTPVATIPCGVDFTSFGVDTPPEERLPFTLGFPLRREPFKGAAEASAAIMLLRARFGEHIRCAAFGNFRMDLPEWVEWHQYPTQTELRRFYNRQSVMMIPSHFEGWGLPGVEAMACGAALVTTDNGGCRDYAIDGVTARLVPPRDPAALAEAVAALWLDDALRRRLARDGNDFVQRYTWANATDRLEQVLAA